MYIAFTIFAVLNAGASAFAACFGWHSAFNSAVSWFLHSM